MVTPIHLTDDELVAFLAGKLTESNWDDIEQHLEHCKECAERLSELPVHVDSFARLLKDHRVQGAAIAVLEGEDSSQAAPRSLAETQDTAGHERSNDTAVERSHPEFIGRYRVEAVLGEGGFGAVYRAFDNELGRPVAIKVPRTRRLARPDQVDLILKEARTVANLDHPHIVPVLDAGTSGEFPYYIVSKFIEGTDLQGRLAKSSYRPEEAAGIVATLADALHYAHKRGFVHRDVKPGNILIDRDGTPHLVDFGLALRDDGVGVGPKHAGTPAYMSPEQARGEGHRVDGRSDVFSLGAVFYEMLVGRRPFRGNTLSEVLEQVVHYEPRPLRQYDERVPKDLQRICFKALSKQASQRYASAHDMAEDLRHFQDKVISQRDSSGSDSSWNDVSSHRVVDDPAVRIVPKGLRPFDAHDADFFLQLLPGPYDRDGLPDSLRFWKTRIEQPDSTRTFRVGLIYGPSGCGKSSLVRAGLLPRLSEDVVPVYVAATSVDTETRILRAVAERCGSLRDGQSLSEILRTIRDGQGLPGDKKLLIVIDQFEQWLHAERNRSECELVRALRQCDGGRVQCILTLRDDFWMAATRFMRQLEVPLVESENTSAVDLFSMRHAQHVLTAYGQAYGVLPSDQQLTADQDAFVKQAVADLADGNRVVCVRLALFAEMMKELEWSPAALTRVGGAEGVGVNFLEATFDAPTARPECARHQSASRLVLQTLLPEVGDEIRGRPRTDDELLAASGYEGQQRDFRDLMRLLDRELRLITPAQDTETGRAELRSTYEPEKQTAGTVYQLAHDYLVPSIREWLRRRQKETRRGRAELLLARRADWWSERRENRQLPSLWEFLAFASLTTRRRWTRRERQMMSQAARVHGFRWGTALLLLMAVAVSLRPLVVAARLKRSQAAVGRVETAPLPLLSTALSELKPLRQVTVPILAQEVAEAEEPRHRARATVALVDLGAADHAQAVDAIAMAGEDECGWYVGFLQPAANELPALLAAAARRAEAERDWRTKARLAIVAMHYGDHSIASDLCRPRPDPVRRTELIDVFLDWHGELKRLGDNASSIVDAHLRSALCLAVGGVPVADGPTRAVWEALLTDWYRTDQDSGTHGAARWALQQWGFKVPEVDNLADAEQAGWRLIKDGLTLVRVSERHRDSQTLQAPSGRAARTFWISERELTVGQFRAFIEDDAYAGFRPEMTGYERRSAFQDLPPDAPVSVTWFWATFFCNWLSWKEGRDPCYELSEIERDAAPNGLREYRVNRVAGTNGFRLPTEAEWEHACRAGTTTKFSFGDDSRRSAQYSTFGSLDDFPPPVGQRRCNPWGLFDMHGSLLEWCWDRYEAVGTPDEPEFFEKLRVQRGGSFYHSEESCTSAWRSGASPIYSNGYGFRIVCDEG